MTKRPLDADMDVQSKKVCLHPELEAMKATLESLLKTADEHHEEAWSIAIDHASELEEKCTECTACIPSRQCAVALCAVPSEKRLPHDAHEGGYAQEDDAQRAPLIHAEYSSFVAQYILAIKLSFHLYIFNTKVYIKTCML